MFDHENNFKDIERIRLRLGMSGAAICREMDLPTNKYSKWRNGSERCRTMHVQAAKWILQKRSTDTDSSEEADLLSGEAA